MVSFEKIKLVNDGEIPALERVERPQSSGCLNGLGRKVINIAKNAVELPAKIGKKVSEVLCCVKAQEEVDREDDESSAAKPREMNAQNLRALNDFSIKIIKSERTLDNYLNINYIPEDSDLKLLNTPNLDDVEQLKARLKEVITDPFSKDNSKLKIIVNQYNIFVTDNSI